MARRPAAEVEQRFMSAVYRWMTVGLYLTSTFAYVVASARTLLEIIVGNRMI